jgi:hypothetical protein
MTMLSEEQIQKALHASRVVPLAVTNPHGPLGLEALAEAVSRATQSHPSIPRVERSIGIPLETWNKLDAVARQASGSSTAVSASDVAAAILERAVSGK